MFRKMLMIGIIAGAVGVLVFGTGVGSYVGTAVGVVKEKIRGSIPTEFELHRAENLIEGIVPEIHACKKVVAEEEVAVEYLVQEIHDLEKYQGRNRQRLDIQKAALERPDPYYFFGGKRYSRAALKLELERCFDEFTHNETLAETKRRLLASRNESLEAAKLKLEKVRIEKSRLENQVQNLYAQLRQVEAMEASASTISLDDSALAKAKKLLSRCKKRLDVAQKMIENDREFLPRIDVTIEGEERDIVTEVNRYFADHNGGDGSPEDALAARTSKPTL